MTYLVVWIVLLIAFAIVEGLTAGLVCIWFCLGSLVALFAAWMGAGLVVQIALFAIVSVVAMALIRPVARQWMKIEGTKTNADRIIEAEGLVIETLDNIRDAGQIKVQGAVWTARSADGAVIPEGALVQVERIEGVRAIVTVSDSGAEKGENEV